MAKRQEMWDRLDGQFDVLVVGGGITGAGIARDAARRGLATALVEMEDIAFGTSSRSSKLVHGGLRYLEHYEFSLVFESVSERRILMDIAPHLVNPLGFVFPVYKGTKRKLWLIDAGMWLYDGLALFRSPKLHRRLDPAQVAELEPSLRQEGLTGAPLYYDCQTDDARLSLETALDAVKHRAVVATHARVRSFVKDETGRVRGAVVEDTLGGSLKEVRANAVINATGPWTDRVIAMSKPLATGSLLRPTKGVHISVPHHKLPVRHAVVFFHPTDDRVLFAIPWGGVSYVGTTDTDYDGDPADVWATRADVDYLLAAASDSFPGCPLQYGDILSTWAGLRPLMKPPSEQSDLDESAVSREHQIVVGQDGLITIAGGKLTTYRKMAAETVETAVKLLRLVGSREAVTQTQPDTDREPLPGAVGWPADDDVDAVARRVSDEAGDHLAFETCRALAGSYGMRAIDIARTVAANPELGARLVADRPEILAQVDWAVENELAATVDDVLRRRTPLYFVDRDQGLGAVPAVASRMARLLGWDDERRSKEIEAYELAVARSRAWRRELEEGGG